MPTIPQQYFGIRLSSLCSLLPRPLILTGIFRDVVASHFASAVSIEDPDLRHLVWSSGEVTNIVVESVHRWRPELTQKTPGVIVKRHQFSNQREGIGDQRLGLTADGNKEYGTYWNGSHTLFCIGGSGAQAELIGSEVQRHLTEFAPVIAGSVKLDRLVVSTIGEVSVLEEAQENFVVPVTVNYTYQQNWEIVPQVPRLNRISVAADTILDL